MLSKAGVENSNDAEDVTWRSMSRQSRRQSALSFQHVNRQESSVNDQYDTKLFGILSPWPRHMLRVGKWLYEV